MCGLLFAVAFVMSVHDPSPFSVDPPRGKRLYLQHAVRKVHGLTGTVQRDSGIWINVLDPTGMSTIAHMPELARMVDAVREGVYGGFPWMLPLAGLVPQSWYLKDEDTFAIVAEGDAVAAAAATEGGHPTIVCPEGARATLELLETVELPSGTPGRRRRQFNFTASGASKGENLSEHCHLTYTRTHMHHAPRTHNSTCSVDDVIRALIRP